MIRSLRGRAILGGMIWAGIAIVLGGVALFFVLDSLTLRRFDETLSARYLRVVAALGSSGGDSDALESYLTDPLYQRPYSGHYWQITGPDGGQIVSRSLFDALLPAPAVPLQEPATWQGAGPDGAVRGITGPVVMEGGERWTVSVAESVASLSADRAQIRRSLLTTLLLIGALGIAATVVQARFVVRPLNRLRHEVTKRWEDEEALDPGGYPVEVAPLVADIRTLLDRNRDIVERGRRQAADLAHALKTPSAILRNELEALAGQGVDVADAEIALGRVDAQIMRSLARVRAAASGADARLQTDLRVSADRMARLFRATGAEGRQLEVDVPEGLRVRMDQQDLEEILGNLFENAFKWSRKKVQVRAVPVPNGVMLSVEDDGPGIAKVAREEALRPGARLDVSMPGSGLGLTIVNDLVSAYGGTVELGVAEVLGGLSVRIMVPNTLTPGRVGGEGRNL